MKKIITLVLLAIPVFGWCAIGDSLCPEISAELLKKKFLIRTN